MWKIEGLLRSKETGEYHSHTFAETIYVNSRTYKKANKEKVLKFYLQKVRNISHILYEINISRNGISISTCSYYMPACAFSKNELELIYKTMLEECSGQE